MKSLLYTSLVLLAVLSSCMVGKKYVRPTVEVPLDWQEQSDFINTNDSINNLKWFAIFNDTVLERLIDTALVYNYDLASAALRIEQARAAYGISKADLLPSVSYGGRGTVNNSADNTFSVLAGASWELDIWGKLRHAKRAAYDEILASEEGLKTVTTTLISDVATFYFLMRDLDNRLAIAKRTVVSRTEYLNLITERFKGGDVSELDQLQADQQLQVAKATVQNVTRQLNGTERSLNILLGQTPQDIRRGLENTDVQVVDVIPAGLPSDLLEQRPDIRQAEYYLAAETERIGVTQAMRLPSISLTGLLGFASADLTSLITDASFVSSATAGIMGPLFNFGTNKRRVEIQRYQAEIAANNYFKTYISALGEVEYALVSVQTFTAEYEAVRLQADASTKSLMLSQERYNNGYAGYLEVLIAENYMLDSELLASQIKAQQLSSYIYLYRALGGGW